MEDMRYLQRFENFEKSFLLLQDGLDIEFYVKFKDEIKTL